MDVLGIDPTEQRRAHLVGDFGPEWEAEPDAAVYGHCTECAAPRTVRRRILHGDLIHWDMVCSNKACPARTARE